MRSIDGSIVSSGNVFQLRGGKLLPLRVRAVGLIFCEHIKRRILYAEGFGDITRYKFQEVQYVFRDQQLLAEDIKALHILFPTIGLAGLSPGALRELAG